MRNHKSHIEVPVIDRDGVSIGDSRTIANPPIAHLLPDKPVVLINWTHGKPQGYVPSEAEVSQPVEYDGKTYHGAWGWGSAAKKGFTIGLTRDLLKETGLGAKSEDGQRVGRWLLANCLYGAAVGPVRVCTVPDGTVIDGVGPVADGFGYVARKTVATAAESRIPKGLMKPEAANDSWQFWQRVPWTEAIRAEALPRLQAAIDEIASRPLEFHVTSGMEDKTALVKLDDQMRLHPYVANSLARSEKGIALRLATAIPTGSKTRVAVPSVALVAADRGKVIVTRYPIDSWGSMRAVDTDAADEEIARVAGMEVVQYSLSSLEGPNALMAKGDLGVADRLPDGVDIVLCAKDIKMARAGPRAARAKGTVTLKNAFFGLTQHYAPGSAYGLNPEFWEAMGGDFDGDPVIVTDGDAWPELFSEVAAFPRQETHKLPKSESDLDGKDIRAKMAVLSMMNVIGFATNVAANTFVYADREELARQLGAKNGTAPLDGKLQFYMKVGTDLFKTDLAQMNTTVEKVLKDIGVLQSSVARLIGRSAPWTRWKRDDWAFVHGVPMPYDKSMGKDFDRDPVARNSIPAGWDGTVAQIARYACPQLAGAISTPIEARPLAHFRAWAARQGDEITAQAESLQVAFNGRVTSVNFTDPEAVQAFRTWWSVEIGKWMDASEEETTALAQALWRVAHDSRSICAGAASVFYAFPQECEWIIREKPGTQDRGEVDTRVLGLRGDVEKLVVQARAVEYTQIVNGKKVIRVALVLPPEHMLGEYAAIPMECETPDVGVYTAHIVRRSPKSWFARLMPMS